MAMSPAADGPHISNSLQPPPRTYIFAAAICILSLGFALVWSHYKLFWIDELLEFYSDSRPSAADVLSGQLHYPFSLEPPGFHLLLHFMDSLFPAHLELGSRLLSVLSLLVTQICVFRITLRLTAHRNAALVAMALPFLLVTFDYAPEARVYSLFAALFALALVCYQSATEGGSGSRSVALWGLYVSLSVAILIHYYGIFLPLPILAGELARILRRRRVDWPVLLAVGSSFAIFAFNVPFLHPLPELQAHYHPDEASVTLIPFTYLWFVFHFNPYRYLPAWGQAIETLCYCVTWLCVSAFALCVCFLLFRVKRGSRGLPVVVALLAGFLLPVANVLVAHYVTHAYVPRYSLPAVISISILAALLFDRPLQLHPVVFRMALSLILAIASLYAMNHIRLQRKQTQISRAEFVNTTALLAEMGAQQDHHIYVQDVPRWMAVRFYLPQQFSSAIVGTESIQRELFWMHGDTASLLVRNIGLSTNLTVVPYETVERTRGPHLFLIFADPESDWVGKELGCIGLLGQPLGPALGGTLYRVTFPKDGAGPSQTCTLPL